MTTPTTKKTPITLFADSITEEGTDQFGQYRVHTLYGVDVTFRRIPTGNFERIDEKDAVAIDKENWMMETAVTQEFWKAVMGYNPSSNQESDQLPVETINWIESQNFINKLNCTYPGINLKLPTSEFWEFASKGGTATRFYTGDTISGKDANFDCSVKSTYNVDPMPAKGKTVPVKSYAPNQYGLYEMCGNVWEWCGDTSNNNPQFSEADVARQFPDKGTDETFHYKNRAFRWVDHKDRSGNVSRRVAVIHQVRKDFTYGWATPVVDLCTLNNQ